MAKQRKFDLSIGTFVSEPSLEIVLNLENLEILENLLQQKTSS